MFKLFLAATLALSMTDAALAQTGSLSQTVDGVTIYLGVIPAEIVRGHPKEHEESAMHGSSPKGAGYRHIVVALFDAKTNERIKDATVTARVEQLGLTADHKDLNPMPIADAISYGNFFRMPGEGIYQILVIVKQKHSAHSIEAKFEYRG